MDSRNDQLEEARRMILGLEQERMRIDEHLNAWKQVRDGLEIIAKKKKTDPLVPSKIGPLDAIRAILAQNPRGLTTMQIREELKSRGVTVGSGNYLMANIHTLIKRDKSIEMVGEGGTKYYRLKDGVSD